MHRRQFLIGISIRFFMAHFFLVGYAKAGNTPLAEEQAVAARGQTAIAAENADRAALTALIAEKQAVWADQKSNSAQPAGVEHELAELKARKTTYGLVLTLGDILFAPAQSVPTTATLHKLSPLVTLLKVQSQRTIRIEGYADSRGSETYNRELSQRRADAVRDFLIANGISPRRIIARGYGEAISVASNTTIAGRQENRRVEVIMP